MTPLSPLTSASAGSNYHPTAGAYPGASISSSLGALGGGMSSSAAVAGGGGLHREIPRSIPYDSFGSNPVQVETDAGMIDAGPLVPPFARPRSSSNPFGHGLGQEQGLRHRHSGHSGHNRGHSFGSASSASSRLRHFSSVNEESGEVEPLSQARRRSQHTPVFVEGNNVTAEQDPEPTHSASTARLSGVGPSVNHGNSGGGNGHSNGINGADHTILLSKAKLDSATKHPRAAVVLGVPSKWLYPLQAARICSTLPAAWWGFRCALTFLAELLLGVGRGSNMALADGDGSGSSSSAGGLGSLAASCSSEVWAQAERRFRVTEVFLAIIWCTTSAYLSFYFAECLMLRWLVNYTPFATLMRMLTLCALIAYVSSLSMWLSGASEDPRMLLPAWVSNSTVLTIIYHLTQRNINIRKETHQSIHAFSYASFATTCALLFQLHLARDNDPIVPLFEMAKHVWRWARTFKIGK